LSHQKAGKYACYEFERKFFLNELPSSLNDSQEYKEIEDKYFLGTNLRLRIIRNPAGEITDRKFTQKYVPAKSTFSKTIITNMYILKNDADFFSQIPGAKILKRRYKYIYGKYIFTIDQFLKPIADLILAEIEFENEQEMENFVPPLDWQEVTEKKEYSGGHIALSGNRKGVNNIED